MGTVTPMGTPPIHKKSAEWELRTAGGLSLAIEERYSYGVRDLQTSRRAGRIVSTTQHLREVWQRLKRRAWAGGRGSNACGRICTSFRWRIPTLAKSTCWISLPMTVNHIDCGPSSAMANRRLDAVH